MYRVLIDPIDAETLIASSGPVWLLKHSRTCPVSAAALDEFTRFLTPRPGLQAGMLVVQDQRPLSNWVAERLKYTHQSPQLFLIREGQVLWHASHWNITVDGMANALVQVTSDHSASRIMAVVSLH